MDITKERIKRFCYTTISLDDNSYLTRNRVARLLVHFDFNRDDPNDLSPDNIHEVEILDIIDIDSKESIMEDIIYNQKYDIAGKATSSASSFENTIKNICMYKHINSDSYELSQLIPEYKIAYAHAYCDYHLNNINDDNCMYDANEVMKVIENIKSILA